MAALAAWARRHPAPPTELKHPWAVAYSGGADSTSLLLAACATWPGRVQAFHVHHGLQSAADGFVRHAQQVCAGLDVPLSVERVNASHRPGQSPEEAARQARYAALARLAHAQGANWVLLGQHAQDQIETVLLALTRGAGLPGLAGMPEVFERFGICFGRPLLGVDGRQLRQSLLDQGMPFLEDPTNTDERYTRNRIRARLLPALAEAFPQFRDTFARSAAHAAEAQRLLDEVATEDLARVGQPPQIALLQQLSRMRQGNVLRHWLRRDHGAAAVPTQAQLQELLDQLAACRTRGHRIHLKVGAGFVERQGVVLAWYNP